MIEIILELLVGLFGEGLIESPKARRAVVRLMVFTFLGAAIGAASLLVFPTHFIRNQSLRAASLLVTPIIAGVTFATIGRLRADELKAVSALEAFWPAFAFALAMAIARFLGAS